MLTALDGPSGGGARIVAVNPLPEAGLIRFKQPAEARRACSAPAPPLADRLLPIRVNGDLALLPGARPAAARRRARPPRGPCSTTRSSPSTATASTGYGAHLAELDWDEVASGDRLDPRPRSTGAELVLAVGRMIVCWAMGLTQHRNGGANDPGDRQPPAAPGQHRQARRRASARSAGTATSRATGPWASRKRCRPPSSTRSSGSSASRPPRARVDAVNAIRAMRGRPRPGVLRHGRQLRPGHARTSAVTEAALRELRADRAGVDEAEPLAHGAPGRRRSSCRPSAAPNATCRRAARSSSASRTR